MSSLHENRTATKCYQGEFEVSVTFTATATPEYIPEDLPEDDKTAIDKQTKGVFRLTVDSSVHARYDTPAPVNNVSQSKMVVLPLEGDGEVAESRQAEVLDEFADLKAMLLDELIEEEVIDEEEELNWPSFVLFEF